MCVRMDRSVKKGRTEIQGTDTNADVRVCLLEDVGVIMCVRGGGVKTCGPGASVSLPTELGDSTTPCIIHHTTP